MVEAPLGWESMDMYLWCVRIRRYQWAPVPIGMISNGARGGGLYHLCRRLLLLKNFAVSSGYKRACVENYVGVKCRMAL